MNRVYSALALIAVVAFAGLCGQPPAAGEEGVENRTPDCVYVGTPNDVAGRMLEMAKIRKEDLVCDPGCGDGRIVIAAAKRFGCRGIGYEIDPKLAAEARKLAQKRKVDHLVTIEERDIFLVDYREADVILMYLLPEMIVKLLPEFEKLKPGSRIVAHDYAIRGVSAEEVVEMTSNEDNVKHTLYLYVLPLKKEF